MNTPVISAHQLGKVLGEKSVLRDVSFDVAPGSVVGLLGKNGAGKTTLLDVLLGFSPPTSGTATVFGANSFAMPAAVKQRVGFVPQQDELIDSLTGAAQLALMLDHYPPPNFTGLITTFLIVVPMLSNTVAGNIARNSHSLWLRSSESRGALFLRAERLAWRAFVFFGVPLSVAAAAAWSVLPHPMFAAAYFVAVLLPVVPCGIYCGLLNFNRPSDLWFLALFLILGMGSLFAATWDGASSAEAICGVRIGYRAIPPVIALLALAIRWFAQRRWRTIDWLRYRAPRREGATRGPLSNN
jgi:hypothetical protein